MLPMKAITRLMAPAIVSGAVCMMNNRRRASKARRAEEERRQAVTRSQAEAELLQEAQRREADAEQQLAFWTQEEQETRERTKEMRDIKARMQQGLRIEAHRTAEVQQQCTALRLELSNLHQEQQSRMAAYNTISSNSNSLPPARSLQPSRVQMLAQEVAAKMAQQEDLQDCAIEIKFELASLRPRLHQQHYHHHQQQQQQLTAADSRLQELLDRRSHLLQHMGRLEDKAEQAQEAQTCMVCKLQELKARTGHAAREELLAQQLREAEAAGADLQARLRAAMGQGGGIPCC